MIKLKYILLFIVAAVFLGCNKEEDDIKAVIGSDEYQLIDSSDPVEKFRFDFYNDTKTILFLSADTMDYRWNFGGNNWNNLHWGDEKDYLGAVEMLKSNFFNKFPTSFFMENFPQAMYLCQKIEQKTEVWDDAETKNAIFSKKFVALAAVQDGVAGWSNEKKEAFGTSVIVEFLAMYLVDQKIVKIPKDFYKISEDDYRQMADVDVDPMVLGFIEYEDYWGSTITQQQDSDYPAFVEYLFAHSNEEVDAVVAKYPKMAKKITILKEMFVNQINLNL